LSHDECVESVGACRDPKKGAKKQMGVCNLG